jgi:hypothetical protein
LEGINDAYTEKNRKRYKSSKREESKEQPHSQRVSYSAVSDFFFPLLTDGLVIAVVEFRKSK